MPGNEVGDRVHNFFGQENLYQGQHQLQAADGTWPVLTDNTWVGSPRQFAAPFISNIKNYTAHQSANSGGGHGNLLSHMSDGFSHTQSNRGPEFGRTQSYNQQKALNGFMQGHHMLQTRQNEAQSLDGPELNNKNLMELETTDAHVSFDLFGGQQQMNGGNLNMMQSLRRQQSGTPDSQLMQQQAMLSQIQGFQRQQQHQFEARHHGLNQVSSIMRQDTGNHSSAPSSSIPVNDIPNYSWQHEHVAGNMNWTHYGASPVSHGSTSGLVSASEQNHALQIMGLIPQQINESHYGVHIPNARSFSGPNSRSQMDKHTYQQLSITSNSFPLNQYTAFPDQSDMQDETSITRQNFQAKSLFEPTADQGLNALNSENLHPVTSRQGNASVQESQGRQWIARRSETLHEKMEMQVTSSQYVDTLDPTEERFLYGSDDNLWDAFGTTTTLGSGGSNMLDGVVFDGGFSSKKSGTWSALMQSAVAETFSSTGGVREEWSGLSSRNAESQNENQHHSGNMQTTSMLKSESCSAPLDASRGGTGFNYCGAPGFQQPGSKSSFEQDESLHMYPAQMDNFSGQESRCLDQSLLQKPLAAGLQISDNVTSGAEIKANNKLDSWTSEQGIPLHKNVNQHGKQNGWNFLGSMSPGRDDNLKYHENQNLPSIPLGSHHRRAIHEEMSHATVMFKNDPASNSRVEMSHTDRAIELPQLPQCYDEGEQVNGDTLVPQSSAFNTDRESKHQYSGPRDIGKDVESLMKKGHNFLDKYQHHLDNNSQIMESFGNSVLNKGASEIFEMEEANRKENFNDGFHSISNHRSAGGFGEHLRSDVDEGGRWPASKQKSTSNVGRKPFLTRKFQYHPLGDLEIDAEPSNGTKHVTHSHSTAQEQFYGYKSHETGSVGQSKFDQADKNALKVDKGNGTTRGIGEISSHKMLSGWVPNKADSFGDFIANDASPNLPPSSQNMLELLHKVDHPTEHGTTTHLSPSNFNLSRMHGAERAGGLIDETQQCQSSASHGFGLQLGPPSQPLSISDTALSSHKSIEAVHISAHTSSGIKGKINSRLAPAAYMQSNSSHEPLKGAFKNQTPCPSESLHFGDSLQAEPKMTNQYSRQADDSCDRIETSYSASASDIFGIVPQPKVDASHVQHRAQESDWLTTSQQGAFSKVSSNEWVSVTTGQQCPQPLKSFSRLVNSFQSEKNLERNFSRPKGLNQVPKELVNSLSGVHSMNLQNFVGGEKPVKESPRKQVSQVQGDTPVPSLSTLQGKESLGLFDAASVNPATTQRDYEAFDHSSRSNSTLDQQFSSLNQVQDKSKKVDLGNVSEKIYKCLDGGTDLPEVASRGQYLSSRLNNIVQEASINHASLSSQDLKLSTFSSQPGDDSTNENGPCLDGLICQSKSENLSISNNISCDRGERSGISPQMAPSWFDRYGSFKNSQMFTVPGRENSTIKLMNKSLPFGVPSDSLSSLHSLKQPNSFVEKSLLDSTLKSSPLSLKEVCQSASDLPSSAFGNQSLVVRPQKRKASTSELLPALDSQRLWNISVADFEWAQAANRLNEKMEDEMEMIDDGHALFRPKKRHKLTTQLIQQLLRPPPSTLLSSDPNLEYDSVVYLEARIAYGDACSAVSTIGIETASPLDRKKHLSGKLKTSAKIGDLHKLMEEFLGRARKLENDLLRMEKGVSILDLRLGFQDLEKFSVINRFAKFHTRGQADRGEASSSDATANYPRICPQRYITPVPMPKNLPDWVQCLSL